MAYIDQSPAKNRSRAIILVAAVHALLGYGLLVGLEYTGIIDPPRKNPAGVFIDLPPPPQPTPDQPKPNNSDPVDTRTFTPPTPFPLASDLPVLDTTDIILPPLDPLPLDGIPSATPRPIPSATTPAFDPVMAKPRNDPGSWVSTNDYRTSWINRELTGTAAFKLQVGTNGRAESCLITRSSGHDVLDQATCDLITKRARFEPARNSKGEKVSGSFSSSVRWQLPE